MLHTGMCYVEVTLLSVEVAVEKQRRFFVDNIMLGVQLADVSTTDTLAILRAKVNQSAKKIAI